MNAKSSIAFIAGAACAGSLAFLVAAGPEHDHDHDKMHEHGDKITQPEMEEMQEMSPEEMMAMMAEFSTPGEHHKALGKTVGTWKAASSFMMDPSAPPMESEGVMETKWILDGRFTHSVLKMDFMGEAFEGHAIAGYDKAHSMYTSTWVDSMSTHITMMKGNMDEGGALVMKGMSTTPMGDNPMKIVSTWLDEDTLQDKFYDKMPDGTWMNSGSITYTRQ